MNTEEQQERIIKDQKVIIAEQRDQLMQLRKQLKDQKVPSTSASTNTDEILALLAEYKANPDNGKTVGLIIPDALRIQIDVEKARFKAYSLKQFLMVCIRLGLVTLQRAQTPAQTPAQAPVKEPQPVEQPKVVKLVVADEIEVESQSTLVANDQAEDEPVSLSAAGDS